MLAMGLLCDYHFKSHEQLLITFNCLRLPQIEVCLGQVAMLSDIALGSRQIKNDFLLGKSPTIKNKFIYFLISFILFTQRDYIR